MQNLKASDIRKQGRWRRERQSRAAARAKATGEADAGAAVKSPAEVKAATEAKARVEATARAMAKAEAEPKAKAEAEGNLRPPLSLVLPNISLASFRATPERDKRSALGDDFAKDLRDSFKRSTGAPLIGRITAIVPFFPFTHAEQAVVAHNFLLKEVQRCRMPINLAEDKLVGELHISGWLCFSPV